MATKQVFLLAFTSILLGYLWVRATCRQSIYCPWETAITSSAKQLAHAVSSGLDQLIVRRVTGSIAGFLELPMSASRRTGAKMLWDGDVRVVGLLPCVHSLQPCLGLLYAESVLLRLEVKNK